jgi:hypothetical protein
VDVTQATGAYIPLSQMSKTAHSRSLPLAVADVCELTYYCQEQDVHPTAKGYALIARLIIRALAKVQ